MDETDLISRSRFLAKVSSLSAVALVALVLLLPLTVDHHVVSNSFIFLWGLFLLVSAIVLGVALMFLAVTRTLKDGPPAAVEPTDRPAGAPVQPPGVAPESLVAVLQEDDRAVYRRIVNAGGSLSQSDLVIPGLFPAPKVSRILDRLEARGLVVRHRQGMSNRVLLSDLWIKRST